MCDHNHCCCHKHAFFSKHDLQKIESKSLSMILLQTSHFFSVRVADVSPVGAGVEVPPVGPVAEVPPVVPVAEVPPVGPVAEVPPVGPAVEVPPVGFVA